MVRCFWNRNKCYKYRILLSEIFDILVNCPVFKGLEKEVLQDHFSSINHFIKSFTEGEVIHFSGDLSEYLLCLLDGSVKGEMVDLSGKVIKIEDIHPPRVLAAAFLFGKKNRFPVNIIASNNTRLLYIPKSDFLKLMQQDQRILVNYLNAISSRTQFLSEKIRFLTFKTIRGKIAQFVLQQAGEDLNSIDVNLSQQALAELFGVTRPALARVMGELEGEGIIKTERRIITILDREKLKALFKDS